MSSTTATYRSILREFNKASTSARATRNKVISSNIRALFEKQREGEERERFLYDMQNFKTFMQSQRIHKELLERYNPLHDLNTEERIKATARRVGLDMPVQAENKDD
ncbi:hypothetical protein BC835DRAFT_1267844 [Cytidiella melzeri]|nr:hypothetical protein BC835DRAFT_1267844 [Cytidiella melzeri]